jgi:O-antigen ligase
VLVLPNDFLRHFGYSKDIIPPYFTIDNNEDLVRIVSTLRGPNILGAYLVLWLPILLVVTKKVWQKSRNWQAWVVLVWVASLVTLYGSQSRSAFAAAAISVGVFVLVSLPGKLRVHALTALAVCVLSFSVVAALNWDSNFVQYRLLHRDPAESIAIDSDDQRLGSLQAAWQDVLDHPLGQGPGAAGLASTYGNNPKITENYYLQIGQEAGLIGMLLFAAILFFAGSLLIDKVKPWNVELALLSGLIGLSLIAFVQPVWGDETVSMLWWSLAGLYIWQITKTKKLPKK